LRPIRIKLIIYFALISVMASSVACRSRDRKNGAAVKGSGVPVGQFKGYQRINTLIRSRLLDTSANRYFDLGSAFLGGNSQGLSILMGGFAEGAGRPSYVNGEPNAISMMLWDTALTGLAESIASHCQDNPTDYLISAYSLNTRGSKAIKSICTVGPNALTDAQLHDLWMWVMSFDAPELVEAEWKAAILEPNSPIRKMPAKDAIKAIMRTIFLNPWFLLET
jgi:hypothetical protein